jgi:tRNA threonylcarbamoyladenosine biosynthesis protein TsaE
VTGASLITAFAAETRELGARIGAAAEPGDVVCLTGDLGSGKTTLTQGIAVGLGADAHGTVVSPTFTIIAEHAGGRIPLFHFDLYRLSGPDDLADIGFDHYLEAGGLTVIEWPERAEATLPSDRLDISLSFASGIDRRRLIFNSSGSRSGRLLEALCL